MATDFSWDGYPPYALTFPLTIKKKVKSEHINLSTVLKETGNSPHALVRI